MDALGVARDLRADHARRVGIVRRAADTTDGALVENLDFECAGRRAIMRTGGGADPHVGKTNGLIHPAKVAPFGAAVAGPSPGPRAVVWLLVTGRTRCHGRVRLLVATLHLAENVSEHHDEQRTDRRGPEVELVHQLL